MSEENGTLDLAEMLVADRDTRRSLRDKIPELERGQSVRIVTSERDVLARVERDARVVEDVDFTTRVVEVPVKIYGDNRHEHEKTVISWWEPGPILLGDDTEHVQRLEIQ